MKQLELKHLAAYLPHKTKVRHDFDCVNILGSVTPLAVHTERGHTLNYSAFLEFKLILKPMSNLTLKELENAGFERSNAIYLMWIFQETTNALENEAATYKAVQYLLSEHYDIFGLIGLGLAAPK